MKKILFIFVALILMLNSGLGQQINYTHGQTTAGVAYTRTGSVDADSSTTINIVFDMQDYFMTDYNPPAYDSVTAIGNSDALLLGTFWVRIDSDSSNDSTNLYVEVYPGNPVYDDNDGTRVEAAEINFSTTALALRDTAAAIGTFGNIGDLQWTPINVYLNASTRILPPEFIKIKMGFDVASFGTPGNGNVYWNFAYPAVYERESANRSTTQSRDAKKSRQTMH
jgi:hypothetical protein